MDGTNEIYIAPIMYLYTVGLLVLWILIGVLIYRAWLRGWIQEARHPFFLRALAECVAIGGFIVSSSVLFWDPLLHLAPWGVDPFLQLPFFFWTIVAFWLIALLIVTPRAMRPYYE